MSDYYLWSLRTAFRVRYKRRLHFHEVVATVLANRAEECATLALVVEHVERAQAIEAGGRANAVDLLASALRKSESPPLHNTCDFVLLSLNVDLDRGGLGGILNVSLSTAGEMRNYSHHCPTECSWSRCPPPRSTNGR